MLPGGFSTTKIYNKSDFCIVTNFGKDERIHPFFINFKIGHDSNERG
jgi:hypothetical protein